MDDNIYKKVKDRSAKIAVIGAGYWGKNLIRNFNDLGVLKAICEQDSARVSELKAQYPQCTVYRQVDELLSAPSIDAVVIATPAESHGRIVRQALNANKDVFVEKPLCLSVSEARQLTTLAEDKQLILMVGHLLWYHPAVIKLKELIDAGELGRIQYIYSNRLNLGRIRREENILWSFAPHDISVILGLIGEMPERVIAQGGNYLHDDIADVTTSLLTFPSGVKAHIFVSWLHPYKEQRLVIVGERKMAVFNDVDKKNKLLLYPHIIRWEEQVPIAEKADAETVEFEDEEPLRAECLHFLDCISTRRRPRTDGIEGLSVLKVLQRCQDALHEDQRTSEVAMQDYFVHESSWIDEDVEIGAETKIWHSSHIRCGSKLGKKCNIGQNVVIGPNVEIGDGVKIQNNVSVYEGVYLEDDVFCGPSVVFTNVVNPRSAIPRMQEIKPTRVGRGATLGANATIVCGLNIGEYAFIGAGAVVTKDIPDYALVVGNPGRISGWMCICGTKLLFSQMAAICDNCKNTFIQEGDRVQLNSEKNIEYKPKVVALNK